MTPNEKIRSLVSSGWTLAELARYLGVPRSTVGRLASDKRKARYELGARIMKIRAKTAKAAA